MPIDIRQPPSGPFVSVSVPGDATTTDLVQNLSQALGPNGAAAANATLALDGLWLLRTFQYSFRSRDELVAAFPPVAGVITLPSGSYFWGSVVLNAGERIVFPANARVLFVGNGPDAQHITGSPGAGNKLVTIPSSGSLFMLTMGVVAVASGGCVEAAGLLYATGCIFNAGGGASNEALSVAGAAYLARTTVTCAVPAVSTIIQTAGTVELTDCTVASTGAAGLNYNIANVATKVCRATNTHFLTGASAQYNVLVTGSVNCDAEFVGCRVTVANDVSGYAIAGDAGLRLRIIGGEVYRDAAPTNAIGVDVVNSIGSLTIVGTRFTLLADGVKRTGGTIGSAQLTSLVMRTVTRALNFNAIPTNGLLVVGCDLTSTTPLTGFTAATALVNLKANAASGALLAETGIVP